MVSIKNLKIPIYNTFWKKLILYIISSKCKNEDEKIFKEQKSTEILKIPGFIENI